MGEATRAQIKPRTHLLPLQRIMFQFTSGFHDIREKQPTSVYSYLPTLLL
jgi:hypothetical protein